MEKTQKGNGDISNWILWFLQMFTSSIDHSKSLIEKSLFVGKYYQSFLDLNLNQRQLKVIKKLLDHLPEDFVGGLTNKKYVSMTSVSHDQNEGRGRSTSYRLNRNR